MLWDATPPDGVPPFMIDLYYDKGSFFALTTVDGKLYRQNLIVAGDTVVLGTANEIDLDQYRSKLKRNRISVHRQADGSYRWMVIAATAVINRMGEIDSTELFDNFIRHIEKGESSYPYLTFFHMKEKMRMGTADFIDRDGVCLIVSGLFDDSKLAKYAARALADDPDYWGISIGFLGAEPKNEVIAEGIEVPVYRDGVIHELSLLPEIEAAAWFTKNTKPMEVNRMKERIMDALKKLVGGDEAAVAELAQAVDGVNERVANENLVSRSADEASQGAGVTDAPIAEAKTEPKTEIPPAEGEAEKVDRSGKADPVNGESGTVQEVVIDDETMGKIVAALAQSEQIVELRRSYEAEKQRSADLEAQVADLTKTVASLTKRVETLSKGEEAKKREYQQDMPARRKLHVTYRPSGKPTGNVGEEVARNSEGIDDVSYQDIADDTLSRFK
jgi:hypothetical protein